MLKKLHLILSFVLMLFMIANSNAQVDPGTENLTHLWTFEDGTAGDDVGTAEGELVGNNIYIENGDLVTVANDPDPITGYGDSWVELPGGDIALNDYDEISVTAWFTPDSAYNSQWNSIWFFGDDGAGAGTGSDGICLQARRGDGHARFWFTAGNPAGYNAEDGVNDDAYGNYNNNVLYHVVCEVNSNGEIIMYHDGVLVGITPLTNNPATGVTKSIIDISPNFARFCHGGYAADYPWVGRLHEVAIYNKALSEEEITFLFEKGLTSVEDNNAQLPEAFSLSQNYPNPFNPETKISFDLPRESPVKIKVFDMLGREMATVLDEVKSAGRHTVGFNGINLSSGVYIYKMDIGSQVFSRKMVLLK